MPTEKRRTAITEDVYAALLAAFRETPGVYRQAGLSARVDWRTAKRAWSDGWVKHPQFVPIKRVLQAEAAEARVLLRDREMQDREKQEELREATRKLALETRVKEGQIAKMAQGTAIQVLASAMKLQQLGQHLGQHVTIRTTRALARTKVYDLEMEEYRAALAGGGAPDKPSAPKGDDHLTTGQAMALLEKLGRYAKQGTELAEAAQRIERLRLGLPEPEAAHAGQRDVSAEEAYDRIERASRIATQARALRVVGGGGEEDDLLG